MDRVGKQRPGPDPPGRRARDGSAGTLNPRLQEIADDFDAVPDKERLQLLLEFSQDLPPLPERYAEHRDRMEPVPECQSPLFLAVEVDRTTAVHLFFDAPAEAPTTRGFAAILHAGPGRPRRRRGAGHPGRVLQPARAGRPGEPAAAARHGGDAGPDQASGPGAAPPPNPRRELLGVDVRPVTPGCPSHWPPARPPPGPGARSATCCCRHTRAPAHCGLTPGPAVSGSPGEALKR